MVGFSPITSLCYLNGLPRFGFPPEVLECISGLVCQTGIYLVVITQLDIIKLITINLGLDEDD